MKPIEQKADVGYMQALRCAEYRVPAMGSLRAPAYLLGLALRYGLIGAAATHDLLLSTADDDEERGAIALAQAWPEIVEEHVLQCVRHKLPFHADQGVPAIVGQLAYQPVGVTLRLFRYGCPLEQMLNAAAEQFAIDYRKVLLANVPLLRRAKIKREFCTMSEKSIAFALHFFDRRQAELEELPEIALIGE